MNQTLVCCFKYCFDISINCNNWHASLGDDSDNENYIQFVYLYAANEKYCNMSSLLTYKIIRYLVGSIKPVKLRSTRLMALSIIRCNPTPHYDQLLTKPKNTDEHYV